MNNEYPTLIRCLAVDDEPLALELLEDNIARIPFLKLVGLCGSAFEARDMLDKESDRFDIFRYSNAWFDGCSVPKIIE